MSLRAGKYRAEAVGLYEMVSKSPTECGKHTRLKLNLHTPCSLPCSQRSAPPFLLRHLVASNFPASKGAVARLGGKPRRECQASGHGVPWCGECASPVAAKRTARPSRDSERAVRSIDAASNDTPDSFPSRDKKHRLSAGPLARCECDFHWKQKLPTHLGAMMVAIRIMLGRLGRIMENLSNRALLA